MNHDARLLRSLPHFLPLLLLSSCADVPRDPLRPVRSHSRERLGLEVAAPASAEERARIGARVDALLARPLTASSAAQIALLNNRRVRAALEEVNISAADLLQAGLPSNPVFHARPRWSTTGLSNTEFGLESEILELVFLRARKAIASRNLAQTQRSVSHEVLNLGAEAKMAYYRVVAGEQQLERLRSIAEINDAVSDIARRVFEAGNISDLDRMELETGRQQVQADMKRARAELESHRAKLNRVLGLSGARARWKLSASKLPAMPPADPTAAGAEAAALSQRQDLVAAREHVATLEDALALKRKTRFIPGLELGVDTERDQGEQLTGPEARIRLPLFDWGQASVRRLESEVRQARAEAEAVEEEVRNDVAASHAALRMAREASEFQQSSLLPQRRNILTQTLLHYNAMQVSNFALLRAKDEEQRAEKDAIENLRDYWLARVELEKAVGGGLRGRPGGKPTSVVKRPASDADSRAVNHEHQHP